MNPVTITNDGIKIPVPGVMKISVEMTEAMYEEFQSYRHDREELARVVSRDLEAISSKYKKLRQFIENAASFGSDGDVIEFDNKIILEAFNSIVEDY